MGQAVKILNAKVERSAIAPACSPKDFADARFPGQDLRNRFCVEEGASEMEFEHNDYE
jgi:hypothetical protein